MRVAVTAAALALLSSAHAESILLRPAAVFDGQEMHAGWAVLVTGDKIAAAGPDVEAPADARTIEMPGQTLMPGMIEGHAHLFLHPYNETSWNDQVTNESQALRDRPRHRARAPSARGWLHHRRVISARKAPVTPMSA